MWQSLSNAMKKYLERKGRASYLEYHQGKLFSWFHEKEKFTRLGADFGVHKGTTVFKINVFKLLDKYPKIKDLLSH